jgi:hypothetical protein
LAESAGDKTLVDAVRVKIDETADALAQWWISAAQRDTLKQFKGSGELDPFIGKGDGISLALAPHRHKLALFEDLTPEVAALVKRKAPDAVAKVWGTFSILYRTWMLVGEERQVHFGENFVDPPEFALGGFRALAWLQGASREELARNVDLPFCRADLCYITKLAIALERARR